MAVAVAGMLVGSFWFRSLLVLLLLAISTDLVNRSHVTYKTTWRIKLPLFFLILIGAGYVEWLLYQQQIRISVIFKEPNTLSAFRKKRLAVALSGTHDYLSGLGIPVSSEMPPILITPLSGGMVDAYHSTYQTMLDVGEKSPAYVYTSLYSMWVMDRYLQTGTRASAPRMIAMANFGSYFNCSYWQGTPGCKAGTEYGVGGALWEIHETYGQTFADNVVARAARSMHDTPQMTPDEPEVFFRRCLLAGAASVSDPSRVREIGLILDRYGLAESAK